MEQAVDDVANQLGLPCRAEPACLRNGLVHADNNLARKLSRAAAIRVIERNDVGWTIMLQKRFIQAGYFRSCDETDAQVEIGFMEAFFQERLCDSAQEANLQHERMLTVGKGEGSCLHRRFSIHFLFTMSARTAAMLLISGNDPLNELVADDVAFGEFDDGDAFRVAEHAVGFE